MKLYEREYFVSRIRSGTYQVKLEDVVVTIRSPTIEDECYGNEAYVEAYEAALYDDIMTEEHAIAWAIERGLWSDEKEQKIELLNKDIDKLKVEIFNNRSKSMMREKIRVYIRATEKALKKVLDEKNSWFSKTCEGIAAEEKNLAMLSRCLYIGKERADVEYIDLHSMYSIYSTMMLDESSLREIARNEPWRLSWTLKEHQPLFAKHEGRQLTNDQKVLLIWSKMYDNIQESMDCPTQDVIDDDDMLDGWFLVQKKKQESERAKSELESRTKNEKIANADEVMVVADSQKEADKIHSMNSFGSEVIRKQRIAQVRAKGGVKSDLEFRDVQLDVRRQVKEATTNRARGK
jgi:hypothetical protein